MLSFRRSYVRCAHYRVCNANSPAAVELLARNGTLPELLLRINDVYFKTLHFVGAGKSWKMSSFFKARHSTYITKNVPTKRPPEITNPKTDTVRHIVIKCSIFRSKNNGTQRRNRKRAVFYFCRRICGINHRHIQIVRQFYINRIH